MKEQTRLIPISYTNMSKDSNYAISHKWERLEKRAMHKLFILVHSNLSYI